VYDQTAARHERRQGQFDDLCIQPATDEDRRRPWRRSRLNTVPIVAERIIGPTGCWPDGITIDRRGRDLDTEQQYIG